MIGPIMAISAGLPSLVGASLPDWRWGAWELRLLFVMEAGRS